MEIEDYVEFLKDLHSILLEYLENIVESNDDFQILINLLEKQKVFENRQEIKEFFHLILIISRNRQRYPDFFSKIDKIFNYFITDIKQTLSKSELFKIFHKNKRILLFLFNKKIITIDETIKNCIIKKINSKDKNFRYFFYPEIESIIEKETSNVIKSELLQIDPEIFTDFEGKRQKGENDSYVCELIRNDSIEKFISYSNLTNLKLTMKIKPSIFETNSYLANKNPTLIEYSAFFGSIQIFQYLFLNKVKLTSSLWIYAIHGKNPDLIHLLEENKILPEDKTYEKCLKKAIKFHHNDIANYIQNNLIDEEILNFNLQKRFNENILAYSFHYYNYSYFPDDLNHKFIFYYLCEYNYCTLVDFLLKNRDFNINKPLIQTKKMFFL